MDLFLLKVALLYICLLYVLGRSLENSDDGVETFYPSSPPPSNNASTGSTPLTGSPLLDRGTSPVLSTTTRMSLGGGGIFSHLKSSRSKNISKEDLSINSTSPSANNPKGKDAGAKQTHGVGSGLSCLAGESNDEELPPPVPHVSTKPSPDKKGLATVSSTNSLSPSMQSISDIFAKQASGKVASKNIGLSPGVSPFASRKTESSGSVCEETIARRTSMTNSQDGNQSESIGSPETGGNKTPDGVIRRQGVGHGTNPELMAEIKEKRASMVPKGVGTDESSLPSKAEKEQVNSGNNNASSNVFGRVRLR